MIDSMPSQETKYEPQSSALSIIIESELKVLSQRPTGFKGVSGALLSLCISTKTCEQKKRESLPYRRAIHQHNKEAERMRSNEYFIQACCCL